MVDRPARRASFAEAPPTVRDVPARRPSAPAVPAGAPLAARLAPQPKAASRPPARPPASATAAEQLAKSAGQLRRKQELNSLVSGRGTIASMCASIEAAKASSSSLAVHADLLARMSRQRKSTNSNQAHKLAWHDAAERMAAERRVAEGRLREQLLAMRAADPSGEAAQLLREDVELQGEREGTARGEWRRAPADIRPRCAAAPIPMASLWLDVAAFLW